MIKLNKVNKWFNKYKKNKIHVINNTSLKLDDTGLVALLGPSGSGKTTLLNAIGGLDKIDSGVITINGKKISSNNSYQVDKLRNLNIGYIFQDYKLVNDLKGFKDAKDGDVVIVKGYHSLGDAGAGTSGAVRRLPCVAGTVADAAHLVF